MSRAGLRGPRRTRVYDCNYNAGEKYYKPALDNLDRKYYGKPLSSERFQSPARPTLFASDPFNDEPIETSRRRAERAITEDAFFDVRGARVPKSTIGAAIDDFDDNVRSSLSRLRANRKATNISSDADFDDTVDSFRRRARIDFNDGLDSSTSDNRAASSSIKKSSFKLTSRREEESEPIAVTKWSALKSVDETDTSAASARVKATKARLDDLESEMFERSEKQLAREKRSQQLKQFLADSDIETVKASF